MTPKYQIIVDGQNLNNIIDNQDKQLLKSLTVVDKIGISADTCDFTIVFDGSFSIPPQKGEVKISVGYDAVVPNNPQIQYGIWEVGSFIVESVSFDSSKSSGETLTVSATSLPQNQETLYALQNSKTRYWQSFELDGTTFATVVNQVCNEASLKATIHPELAGIQMPFTAQINQKDSQFLTYISALRDGVVKYGTGRGSDGNVAYAKDLITITLKDKNVAQPITIDKNERDIISYNWKTSSRNEVKRVEAEYTDNANNIMKVSRGEGLPAQIIENRFPDKVTAENAAQALLNHLNRKVETVTIEIATIPNLKAETPLTLSGFLPEINGEYIIESVTHRLTKGSGLTSSIVAQLPTG